MNNSSGADRRGLTPPGTFPRSARLLTRSEFDRVFRHRQARADRYFRIHYAPSDTPRLGQVITRRVSRRAVDRNRIRRLVRECFRLRRHRLPPMDFLVVARGPDTARAGRAELARSLDVLYDRISREHRDEHS